MSAQSERYERIFARFLHLYPQLYRERYGRLMRQNLHDHFRDAEALGDPHVTRDIFLSALFELPGNILREYLDETGRFRLPITRWTAFTTSLLAGIVYAYTTWVTESSFTLPLMYILASVLVLGTFIWSRRIFLAFVMLTTEVSVTLLGYLVMIFLGTEQVVAFSQHFLNISAWMLMVVLPVLLGYLLLVYYRAHALRFKRDPLRGLSLIQIAELREKIRQRRKRNFIIIGALVTVFLVMNLAGLYDPPVSELDLTLSVRTIAPEQNMFYDLAKIDTVNGDVYNSVTTRYSSDQLSDIEKLATDGTTWNQERANSYLAGSYSEQAVFQTAAAKSDYQQPDSANSIDYQGIDEAQNLVLLDGESARRRGDLTMALSDALVIIKVGEAMQESHTTIIGELVALNIRDNGLGLVQRVLAYPTLTRAQIDEVSIALGKDKPSVQGLSDAYTAEYLMSHASDVSALASDLASYQLHLPGPLKLGMLPYFFQLNRTQALFADATRREIISLQSTCKEPVLESSFSWIYLLEYNGLGKELIGIATPAPANTIRCQADFALNATKAIIQLKEGVTGPLPEDPYTGEPLLNDAKNSEIYSAGRDMTWVVDPDKLTVSY